MAAVPGLDLGAVWPIPVNPDQVGNATSVGPLSNLVATTGGNLPTTQPAANPDKVGNSPTEGLEPVQVPQVPSPTSVPFTNTVIKTGAG